MAYAASSKIGTPNDFFKLDDKTHLISYIPSFMTAEAFKALPAAELREFEQGIERGDVERYKDGYIYPEVYEADVCFAQNEGFFRYDPTWNIDENLFTGKNRPQKRLGLVVLRYETSADGQLIIVPEGKRQVLSDNKSIPFEYKPQIMSMTVKTLESWRSFWKDFPPTKHDYTVRPRKQGGMTMMEFIPSPKCGWRSFGDALIEQVIRDSQKMIKDLPNKIGRKVAKDVFMEKVLNLTHQATPTTESGDQFSQFMS